MTQKQLKELIREEYHNVKSFMEDKYGFVPELGQVVDNPYVSAFKIEDYLETSVNEAFKSEYEGNDNIIWKKGKTRNGVTNFTPYYKGHNIDIGGHNFKTEKELKDFIKDYILSNQLYRKYRNESVNEDKTIFENLMIEGVMSNIHLMVDASKDFEDFKKKFKKNYRKVFQNTPDFMDWLYNMYKDMAPLKAGEKVESIQEYDVENEQDIREFIEFMKEYKADINEAEYQGRDVKLGKIMQGDVKKFKVYVKNPKGNVVKVNFGHGGSSAKGKTMKIKKSNPERRKAFRARHNCDNPGPRHKARYWACRTW